MQVQKWHAETDREADSIQTTRTANCDNCVRKSRGESISAHGRDLGPFRGGWRRLPTIFLALVPDQWCIGLRILVLACSSHLVIVHSLAARMDDGRKHACTSLAEASRNLWIVRWSSYVIAPARAIGADLGERFSPIASIAHRNAERCDCSSLCRTRIMLSHQFSSRARARARNVHIKITYYLLWRWMHVGLYTVVTVRKFAIKFAGSCKASPCGIARVFTREIRWSNSTLCGRRCAVSTFPQMMIRSRWYTSRVNVIFATEHDHSFAPYSHFQDYNFILIFDTYITHAVAETSPSPTHDTA